MTGEEKRKFHNPTGGYVGATILDDDNKPKGVPVDPGGSIWLSQVEERLTAEAPRLAENNPFTKQWTRVLEYGPDGRPSVTEECEGVLILSEEPARTILSDRYIPSEGATRAEVAAEEKAAEEQPPAPERPAEVEETTGAPPLPKQPPVEGQPGPDEHVATPEAVAANDEHLARLAAEENAEEAGSESEGPTPVGEDGAKGADRIGVRREEKTALV